MPFYLKEIDVFSEVAVHESVLIVVCRFCPAASMAARYGVTYLEPLRRGLRTQAFEDHVDDLVSRLEEHGVRTSVMRGNLRNYIVCVWSERQRAELARRASQHEAIVVMGCRGAYESVCRMVGSTECKVYRGMVDEGILGVTPRFHLPFRLTLDLFGVTPLDR